MTWIYKNKTTFNYGITKIQDPYWFGYIGLVAAFCFKQSRVTIVGTGKQHDSIEAFVAKCFFKGTTKTTQVD